MGKLNQCICSTDLNRFMTVQQIKPTATIDSSGHIDESDETNWIKVGKQWCRLIPKSSREFLLGDQVQSDVTHQITMRFTTATSGYLTTATRMFYNGRIFNLAGPPQNIEEADRWLLFPAIEKPQC